MSETHDLRPEVRAAAYRFVVPMIEMDLTACPEDTRPDIVGLGLSIGEWCEPEHDDDGALHWHPDNVAGEWGDVATTRKPRALTADRVARCIVQGFVDGAMTVELYDVAEIEELFALAPLCGPTNRRRLHRLVEAWVEHAPDEAFLPGASDYCAWPAWELPDGIRL